MTTCDSCWARTGWKREHTRYVWHAAATAAFCPRQAPPQQAVAYRLLLSGHAGLCCGEAKEHLVRGAGVLAAACPSNLRAQRRQPSAASRQHARRCCVADRPALPLGIGTSIAVPWQDNGRISNQRPATHLLAQVVVQQAVTHPRLPVCARAGREHSSGAGSGDHLMAAIANEQAGG